MKRLSVMAALAASAVIAFAAAEVGQPAPDFTAKDIHGKTHKLSDYKGKIVVLEAYNIDCPFCANHYKTGAMQDLQSELTGKGVVWLIVNSTARGNPSYRDPATAKKEIASNGIKATAWLDDHDGTVGKAYNMKTTPHMFVVDKNGVLAYEGAIDDAPVSEGDPRKAKNYVRNAVQAITSNRPVEVAKTRPYGCGVKYAN